MAIKDFTWASDALRDAISIANTIDPLWVMDYDDSDESDSEQCLVLAKNAPTAFLAGWLLAKAATAIQMERGMVCQPN